MFPVGCQSSLHVCMFCVSLLLDFSKDINLKNSLSPHSLASTDIVTEQPTFKMTTAEDRLWCLRQDGRGLVRYVEDFLELTNQWARLMPRSVSCFRLGLETTRPHQLTPRQNPPHYPAKCPDPPNSSQHRLCPQPTAVNGQHRVHSRARSGPGDHGVHSRARFVPGAQGVHSRARSVPGAYRAPPGVPRFQSAPKSACCPSTCKCPAPHECPPVPAPRQRPPVLAPGQRPPVHEHPQVFAPHERPPVPAPGQRPPVPAPRHRPPVPAPRLRPPVPERPPGVRVARAPPRVHASRAPPRGCAARAPSRACTARAPPRARASRAILKSPPSYIPAGYSPLLYPRIFLLGGGG